MSASSHAANAATPAAITEKTRLAFAVRSFHQIIKCINASVRHAPPPIDQMTVTQFIAPCGSKGGAEIVCRGAPQTELVQSTGESAHFRSATYKFLRVPSPHYVSQIDSSVVIHCPAHREKSYIS